jgi:transposase
MPRPGKVVPHLPIAELQARSYDESDRIARDHWRILWLVAQGYTGVRAARLSGYSAKWVGLLVRRYNAAGPTAVGDQRRHLPGAAPLLSAAQQAALATALEGPAPDGGLWTSTQVAAWMSAQLGRPVSPQRGWEYLRRCGFTPHRPRPRHAQADAAAQAAFRKASRLGPRLSSKRILPRPSKPGPPTNTASG